MRYPSAQTDPCCQIIAKPVPGPAIALAIDARRCRIVGYKCLGMQEAAARAAKNVGGLWFDPNRWPYRAARVAALHVQHFTGQSVSRIDQAMAKRKKLVPKKDADAPPSASVADLRHELDEIDRELVETMNRRAEIAKQIGVLKQAGNERIFDPYRETEVLRQAVEANRGPLSDESVRAVFRELVSGTRTVQAALRVAYLGP